MANEVKDLISKTKNGFETLNVPDKYTNAALKSIEQWLTEEMFSDYRDQIKFLITSGKWNILLDSFYQVIPFGTGGRRGLVGIGPNRINKWTIQASAQGHSQYLISKHGNEAKKRGIALTFDVRKYIDKVIYNNEIKNPVKNLDCKDLATSAAEVYAANGIKIYMYDSPRSTPQLSFTIRYVKAISGDMFSASHNPPSDNGKKVYDQFGGQFVPPYDQELVDEVTQKVKTIKTMPIADAKKKGLIVILGEKEDNAYIDAVSNISFNKNSDVSNISITYSPLHGTGLTSAYLVLKRRGFDVKLDPKTSNMSGAFENVMFNIPNPEVIESFLTMIEHGKLNNTDLLINTDPDADRIGIMVKHNKDYKYLNGNEIGIILADYGIKQFKKKISGKSSDKKLTIIKTCVTSSLISHMAKFNGVNAIGELLVGFKYIGEEMNKLESERNIDGFIMGCEESHGFLMGNYSRDKDGAGAALWLGELASELKRENKTLIDRLDQIYANYGYCHNYLTEIRLPGAQGMDEIAKIMNHLRNKKIPDIRNGKFKFINKIDRLDGEPQPHLSLTDTASRNVLIFELTSKHNLQSIKLTIRPSGTEPKIKMYFELLGNKFALKDIEKNKKSIVDIRTELEQEFMKYCYKILGVDFPDRGFLLFWQIPLLDKMKYFEIEDKIVELKKTPKTNRLQDLMKLLSFLGSNPVEKIDKAFIAKYKKGILKYLEI